VPTDAEIVTALRRKAEKGDAAAARELREWLDRDLASEDAWDWLEALSAEQRRTLGEWLEEAEHAAHRHVA
jgi:hypothetical protein